MTRLSCPVFTKNRLREEQHGKCAFCNIPTDAQIFRNGNLVQLSEEFDHFVPISYGGSNSLANWVLSCNVCNTIKSDRMFTNMRHARIVIEAERSQKGYEDAWTYHRRTVLGIVDQPMTNGDETDISPKTNIYEEVDNPEEWEEPTKNDKLDDPRQYYTEWSESVKSTDSLVYDDKTDTWSGSTKGIRCLHPGCYDTDTHLIAGQWISCSNIYHIAYICRHFASQIDDSE